MSNFHNGVGQALDDTRKAILDIENKKKTISQASSNEQNSIQSKINEAYKNVGEIAYALYDEGSFSIDKVQGIFESIKDLHYALGEKQTKLNEILGRYDEELEILQSALPVGEAACSGCGLLYTPGEMRFCRKCGNSLSQEPSASDTMPQLSSQRICDYCDAPNISTAVFCSKCGNKFWEA